MRRFRPTNSRTKSAAAASIPSLVARASWFAVVVVLGAACGSGPTEAGAEENGPVTEEPLARVPHPNSCLVSPGSLCRSTLIPEVVDRCDDPGYALCLWEASCGDWPESPNGGCTGIGVCNCLFGYPSDDVNEGCAAPTVPRPPCLD